MPKYNNDPVTSVNKSDTPAIAGEGVQNEGVRGTSHNAHGAVVGVNDFAPVGPPGAGGNGGWFESAQGEGVRGWAKNAAHGGVVGVNTGGGFGVYGTSDGSGVVGEAKTWMGVYGKSASTTGGAGVMGEAVGAGVIGKSETWMGVYGETASTTGGAGVWGEHKGAGNGVVGVSAAGGVGVYGKGGRLAGHFEGDVEVTGDIRLSNADCAEDFDVAGDDAVEPGSVMVLGDGGALQLSGEAYDKRVAGVISGAGNYRPGIILDAQESTGNRAPIALLGKAYCKVDARYAPVEVGDLLATSHTAGHAMKVTDPARALGTVIGKALHPLSDGEGLIPIMIALQ